MITPEEIGRRFDPVAPEIEGTADLARLFVNLACHIAIHTGGSREQSLALTALEEASMWAHKAHKQSAEVAKVWNG